MCFFREMDVNRCHQKIRATWNCRKLFAVMPLPCDVVTRHDSYFSFLDVLSVFPDDNNS